MLTATILLAALAAATQAQTDDTVLVLELKALGVEAQAATALSAELARLIDAQGRERVVTMDEVRQLLDAESQRAALGCEDQQCLASITRAAQARRVLTGSLGAVGGEVVVSLSLLDSERGVAVGSATRAVANVEAATALLPELLAELFSWSGEASQRQRYRLPEGQRLSFAVFDLKPLGLPEETAQNLTQLVAGELKRIEGASVVSRDDIQSMLQLESSKQSLGCEDNVACLAEIGGALGVDKLILGHVGLVGQRHVISLRLLNARQALVESRYGESFLGQEEQLLPAVRVAVRELLGIPAAANGKLVVTTSANAVDVFLDAAHVGQAPMPPLTEVVPGKHHVRVAKAGYYEWSSDVFLEPGETSTLWIELESKPTRWGFFGPLGGTALLAAGGAVFGALALSNHDRARELAVSGERPGERTAALGRFESYRSTSNALWIGTAVGAVVTLVGAYLTDWD